MNKPPSLLIFISSFSTSLGLLRLEALRRRTQVFLWRMGMTLALLMGQTMAVQAQSIEAVAPIGMVKTMTGQAFIDNKGQRMTARLGAPVFLGSRLVTASGSTLGVTFRDETVMAIGPDTQLVIDQYLFAPREGKLSLVASLARGTLNYVSGQIAKLRPEAVNVNTPTGMIGVRGTQFVVRVDPE